MNEATVRAQFAKGLRKYGHVVSIENAAGVGTPDLNVCIDGQEMWIEVKYFAEWPKRQSTPINIGGKNKASWARECAWMKQRIAAGGVCYVYARIGKIHYIFNAEDLLENSILTRNGLYQTCFAFWGTPDWGKVAHNMTSENIMERHCGA